MARWAEAVIRSKQNIGPNPVNGRIRISKSASWKQNSSSRIEVYSADVQHIARLQRQMLIIGGRAEWTLQDAFHSVADPDGENFLLLGTNNPVSVQNARPTMFGASFYAYDYLTVTET